MNTVEIPEYLDGIHNAVVQANQTGFVADVRFTILADVMHMQMLRAENMDLLEFTIPEGLYDTVRDMAKFNRLDITVFNAKEPNRFIIEFASADDQDKFMGLFAVMAHQGKRAFALPNLYLGHAHIDKPLCLELIMFFIDEVKRLEDAGWNKIK
jgi:hypothetical protein